MKYVNIPKVVVRARAAMLFSCPIKVTHFITPSHQVHGPCHYRRNLRKFGCGLNFCTSHWELFHRDGVVKPFKTVRVHV